MHKDMWRNFGGVVEMETTLGVVLEDVALGLNDDVRDTTARWEDFEEIFVQVYDDVDLDQDTSLAGLPST